MVGLNVRAGGSNTPFLTFDLPKTIKGSFCHSPDIGILRDLRDRPFLFFELKRTFTAPKKYYICPRFQEKYIHVMQRKQHAI